MSTFLSLVLKNFNVPHNITGVIRVQCKHCETFISGTSSSAGNFMKHLKRKHLKVYMGLIREKYKYDPSTLKNTKSSGGKKISSVQQDDSASNEGSPKKYMNYTEEFKVKILEYYFKNGGENKYGLKGKTAQLFRVDKKTINRMLCNPEMVRKACKAINQKLPPEFATSKSPQNTTDNDRTNHQNSSIIDLPEDPDFSVLKQAISSPASGIGNVTRLLLTGAEEIQKIILEECDLIFECKVCKNLFRSIVNFLAHKRIYCMEKFVNVQNIFHKDNCDGNTTDSNTIIVQPEPPDCFDLNDCTTKIDRIASKLAIKTTTKSKKLSSATSKGSSKYYDMIAGTQEHRNALRKDSSVVLKRLGPGTTAVYQDYVPHGQHRPVDGTKELARQAIENRMGVTAILDEDGKIVGTQIGTPSEIDVKITKELKNNNSYIDSSPADSPCESPSLEENETDDSDSYERTIYTCPICSCQFLSMGGCNKHLLKVHKKKKHQRERLRQVIASRTYKKTFTWDAIKNYHLKNETKSELPPSNNTSVAKIVKSEGKVKNEVVEQPREMQDGTPKLQNLCIRCKKTFLTAGALGSHIKYCQFQPINPKSLNEQPEKKIAIQIRKDYNKKDCLSPAVSNNVYTHRSRLAHGKDSTPAQRRIWEEVAEKSKMLSNPGKLNCIPCKRKFPKRSSLQYHVAKHLNYNRYKCLKCDFRSYHRYTIVRHCEMNHWIPNCTTQQYHEEDKVGVFVYYLEDQALSSDPTPTPNDDDYKKLLNSSADVVRMVEVVTEEVKVPGDDVIVTIEEADPLAIENLTKEEGLDATEELPVGSSEEICDSISKIHERPQRQRKTVEQKDFIYEIKLPQSVATKTSFEEEGMVKQEVTNKRKGSPVEEQCRKKVVKIEENLCNGKSESPKPTPSSGRGLVEDIESNTELSHALDKNPDSPRPKTE